MYEQAHKKGDTIAHSLSENEEKEKSRVTTVKATSKIPKPRKSKIKGNHG